MITIEFSSLRGHQMDGIYEVGHNALTFLPVQSLTFFPQTNFASFPPFAASCSNTIVPIVSFKELLHGDWKRIPAPVASGLNGNANVVVCTHLDEVSQENMNRG